jgi:hypothetical protein
MIVTISEFKLLSHDANGHVLPLGKRTNVQSRGSAGAFTALAPKSQFIRLATDTSILLDIVGGGHDTLGELFVANSVEYIGVDGGETLTIAVA